MAPSFEVSHDRDPPPTLAGFESVYRYWDGRHGRFGAKIKPGEFYVTRNDEVVTTVLGSCIAACVRDPALRIGGMNHFMLPVGPEPEDSASFVGSKANRYGNFAMEHLVNVILEEGGRRERLEVKIFGGGQILNLGTDIGGSNIRFVHRYLDRERIAIVAEDVGDTKPRKVIYLPRTGQAFVKKMQSFRREVAAEETRYLNDLIRQPLEGEIELFSQV